MTATVSEAHSDGLQDAIAVAEKALSHYRLDGASVSLLNRSENTTFLVADPTAERRWILRVHRPGYHSARAITSELEWLAAIRQDQLVPTHSVIAGTDGAWLQTVQAADLDGPRHCVLFSFLPGSAPDETRLGPAFEALGEVTARLHRHSYKWELPPTFERPSWDLETTIGPHGHWGDWRDAPGMTDDGERLLSETRRLIADRLSRYGTGSERFGLIHADLRLANLLVHGEETQVIDFDDCGFGWYFYDLAAALSFIEDRPDLPELIDAWLRGYRKTGHVGDADIAELPTFIMLRRILLTAWIGSHGEAEEAQALGATYTDGTFELAKRYMASGGQALWAC